MEMNAIIESIRIENELKTGASAMDMFKGTDLRRTLLCIGCVSQSLYLVGTLIYSYFVYQ